MMLRSVEWQLQTFRDNRSANILNDQVVQEERREHRCAVTVGMGERRRVLGERNDSQQGYWSV